MNAIKLASLYFFGTEEFTLSNSMLATVTLKSEIDSARLFHSYRNLIMENPLLQTKVLEQPEKNTFEWGRFSGKELEYLLNFEKEQLSRYFTMEEILEHYDPTNSRLPFHIFLVNKYTLVFSMSHAIAHGLGLTFWINRWLESYSGIKDKKEKNDFFTRNNVWRILKKARAFLWLPVFILGFIVKALGNTRNGTVDLSYGKKPEKGGNYSKKSYSFSKVETLKILRQCRLKKMTLSEYICYKTTKGLFEYAPQKRRAFISIPMDIQHLHPYSKETMCGNFIGSLPAQFFWSSDLEKQVKSAFKWIKRGVPYSLSFFFASFSNSYMKYKKQCLELCMKTIPERAPLWDFSVTFSNLGIISYPIMEKYVESIYFSFRHQSILLSASTLSGQLMMEVCVSKSLYDPEEVFQLFDRILSLEYLLD